MHFPDSEFWNYSLQAWGLPGVESACLELQDTHAMDVNLLLYCCWAGSQQRALSEPDLVHLLETAGQWQTIITPLRQSRRALKLPSLAMPPEMIEQSLEKIREIELSAEHMAQIALESSLTGNTWEKSLQSRAETSLANLLQYTRTLPEQSSTNPTIPALRQLIESLYPQDNSVATAFTAIDCND